MPWRFPCRTTAPEFHLDKMERIFEAYYTTKEKVLAVSAWPIVKHDAELLRGGNVRVESELGKGAKFTVIFPAKALIKFSEMNVQVATRSRRGRRGKTCVSCRFQTVLKDEGYVARAVESAEAALELLAQEEFFMVITDATAGSAA